MSDNRSARTDMTRCWGNLQKSGYWKECGTPIKMILKSIATRAVVEKTLVRLQSEFTEHLRAVHTAYEVVADIIASSPVQAPAIDEVQILQYEVYEQDFFKQLRFSDDWFYDFGDDVVPLTCQARRSLRFFWVVVKQTCKYVARFNELFWGPLGGLGTKKDREDRAAEYGAQYERARAHLKEALAQFDNACNNRELKVDSHITQGVPRFLTLRQSTSTLTALLENFHPTPVKKPKTLLQYDRDGIEVVKRARKEPGVDESAPTKLNPTTPPQSSSSTAPVTQIDQVPSPSPSPLANTSPCASQSSNISDSLTFQTAPLKGIATILSTIRPHLGIPQSSSVSVEHQIGIHAISHQRELFRNDKDDGDEGEDGDEEDDGDIMAQIMSLAVKRQKISRSEA